MKKVNILLVEDNEGDILLTHEAFEQSDFDVNISTVRNGKDAIDFLLETKKNTNLKKPDLVLLDLNIPLLNGFEVLKKIKGDSSLKAIAVIMLTTSSNPKEISKAYEYQADGFITKPADMTDFLNSITTIQNYWIQLSQESTEQEQI